MLIAVALIVGAWLANRLESTVMARTALLSDLYVQGLVAPQLDELITGGSLSPARYAVLDEIFQRASISAEIAVVKVWLPDSRIAYSTHPELIGRQFPPGESLRLALAGEADIKYSTLSKPDNLFEIGRWDSLKDVYIPLRDSTGNIYAVVELYLKPATFESIIRSAEYQLWGAVAAGTLLFYLALLGLVRQANIVILRQHAAVIAKSSQLEKSLIENKQMRDRIRNAGARLTALNERYLHQLSTDLHDGAAQDMAVALMQMKDIREQVRDRHPVSEWPEDRRIDRDFTRVEAAMNSALHQIRGNCYAMRIPCMEALSVRETVSRVIRDYEIRTGQIPELQSSLDGLDAPLAVKIALYRVVQESLMNGFRHARGGRQWIALEAAEDTLFVEVGNASGSAAGEVEGNSPARMRLGVAGMRERVLMLGGAFEVSYPEEGGAVVRVTIPLVLQQEDEALVGSGSEDIPPRLPKPQL